MKKRKGMLCFMLAVLMAVLPVSTAFASENEEIIETAMETESVSETEMEMETESETETEMETESESETEEEIIPGKVVGLRPVSTGKKQITMSWDPVEDIEDKTIVYVIYGKKGDADFEFRGMSDETTFTDRGATGLVKTEYKVCASYMSDDGSHRVFGPESNIIITRAMLAAPESVDKAPAGKNRVALHWDAVEDADGYLIYAQKNGKYGYCGMTSDGKTSFTDVKALDTDYNYYWVYPYYYEEDSEGNNKMAAGIPSSYVYCKGVLPAVSNLKAQSSDKGITITWGKVKDADGYLIYRQKGNSGKFEYVYMKDANSTSYYDTKCAMEEYNYYRVFPYHMNGETMVPGVSDTYVYAKVKQPVIVDYRENYRKIVTQIYNQTDKRGGGYALHDLNGDGVYELIVGDGYVPNKSRKTIYSYNIDRKEAYEIGYIASAFTSFYRESESSNAMIVVDGYQAVQSVYRVTMKNNKEIKIETLIRKDPLDPGEDYYSTPYPIKTYMGDDLSGINGIKSITIYK